MYIGLSISFNLMFVSTLNYVESLCVFIEKNGKIVAKTSIKKGPRHKTEA